MQRYPWGQATSRRALEGTGAPHVAKETPMRTLWLLSLAACAAPLAELPQSGPPMWVDPGTPYAGQVATVTVQGATPGDQVYVVASRTRGAGPCPARLDS